jgi:hypothetical protein
MDSIFGIAVTLASIFGSASAARADWGFTHWGMTPEQVAGASGGTAHLIAQAARTRSGDKDGWEIAAEGSVAEEGMTLDGGYMFDGRSGGLICVMYNARGDNVGKIRDGLLARYGRPSKDSDFGAFRTLAWKTPDEIELSINKTPLTAAVTHCSPGH